ncbi:GTP:AMP phosphotransferase AK3, mitochondrial-like [Drosophila obscura]|uniref:GTP:AMP phosphotransferase AK3, mitochondrial-like n=1 Tax=Drosophila obscura TaxID=7282 RepID=UPI001BB182F3|nr:GTP:AMP phosphotransferase AK3, mitochondrial-like [Drosophila obscura]
MNAARGFRAMIVGPPGCGKGFVAQMMVKTYGAVHISTGDMLRDHIRYRTWLGKRVERFTTRGKLVPDNLLTRIVTDAIGKAGNRNLILDGFPRNINQARALDEMMTLDFVLDLFLPMQAIIARLRTRLVHPASGRVYNDHGDMAPRVPGRDDITGERLVRRADDTSHSVVMARQRDYVQETYPVIQHYSQKNILHTILARQHESMVPLVKRYLAKRWPKRIHQRFRPQRRIELVCNQGPRSKSSTQQYRWSVS